MMLRRSAASFTCLAGLALLGACTLGAAPEDGPVETAEQAANCGIPIDISSSLFVTESTALASFSFQAVMDKIVASGGSSQTSLALYQQLFDTNNPAAQAQTSGPHCDDQVDAGGHPAINGFPIDCPRQEGLLAKTNPFTGGLSNQDGYHPIGLVNRFDLAPKNGADCGEYRVVFGKNSGNPGNTDRNLIIFEAKLPNPDPASGIQGCQPVAQFWQGLTGLDAATRASKLQSFYFTGLTGFEPVISWRHYAGSENGSGQIRANQFMASRRYLNGQVLGQQWQLREYELTGSCTGSACLLTAHQATVKNNPFGGLFSTNPGPLGAVFQADFVNNRVKSLTAGNVNGITMKTPLAFDSGQSSEQDFSNAYTNQNQGNTSFQTAVQSKLTALASDLTPVNITDRATTQSCAGCHQLSNNQALGDSVTWPQSNIFTQIDELSTLSPALTTRFLPHRKSVLETFLCSPSSLEDTEAGTLGGSAIE